MNRIINKIHNNKSAIVLLVISATSYLLFLRLLLEIVEKEKITLLDERILNYIYSIRTPFFTNIMLAITSLGNTIQVVIVCSAVILTLFLYKKYKHIVLLIFSFVFNEIFVIFVKAVVERPRPEIQFAIITENNFSFPSGHTIIAVCFYGVIAYIIYKLLKNKAEKVLTFLFAAVLILAIGFSRIYLGVHWPTDVLASYLLGLSWFCLLIFFIHYRKSIKRYLSNLPIFNKIIVSERS